MGGSRGGGRRGIMTLRLNKYIFTGTLAPLGWLISSVTYMQQKKKEQKRGEDILSPYIGLMCP